MEDISAEDIFAEDISAEDISEEDISIQLVDEIILHCAVLTHKQNKAVNVPHFCKRGYFSGGYCCRGYFR